MLGRRNFSWVDITRGNKAMGRHNLHLFHVLESVTKLSCTQVLIIGIKPIQQPTQSHYMVPGVETWHSVALTY